MNALDLAADALETTGTIRAPKQSPKARAAADIAIIGIRPPNMVFKPWARPNKAAKPIACPGLAVGTGSRTNKAARAIRSPMHLRFNHSKRYHCKTQTIEQI